MLAKWRRGWSCENSGDLTQSSGANTERERLGEGIEPKVKEPRLGTIAIIRVERHDVAKMRSLIGNRFVGFMHQ